MTYTLRDVINLSTARYKCAVIRMPDADIQVERGIRPNIPSDALDMSRWIIIDAAVLSIGATEWELRGDTLAIACDGATLDLIPNE